MLYYLIRFLCPEETDAYYTFVTEAEETSRNKIKSLFIDNVKIIIICGIKKK